MKILSLVITFVALGFQFGSAAQHFAPTGQPEIKGVDTPAEPIVLPKMEPQATASSSESVNTSFNWHPSNESKELAKENAEDDNK